MKKLILIFLLVLFNNIIKAQDDVNGLFSGNRKKINLTIINLDSLLTLELPNTIRADKLTPEAIQVLKDTLILSFTHNKGEAIDVIQTDVEIIEVGILAYETIAPLEQKQYRFKLPSTFFNTKKINVLILLFDNKRRFMAKPKW